MRSEQNLSVANAIREVINDALSRYDIPSDIYESDTGIDGDCVRLADTLLGGQSKHQKSLPTLSWNMSHDGVAEVSATDSEGRMFPVLDVFRQPLITRGGMSKDEAKAFQVFAAERICKAWNADETAADIAEGHKIDPALGGDAGLTDWGKGHNAACDQIAHEIRRRFKF